MAAFSRTAERQWEGDVLHGQGQVVAASGAFTVGATFPMTTGDPPWKTSPEELLAASHATCFGIGLRSLIAQYGGRAARLVVTATITAEKGSDGIRIRSSHLAGVVDALENLEDARLADLVRETAERCTISLAIRGAVRITHDFRASRGVGRSIS